MMYPTYAQTRRTAARGLLVAAIHCAAAALAAGLVTVAPLEAHGQRASDVLVQTIPGTELSFELVRVPGGSFRLGSPEDEPGRDADEGPQRTVSVDPFWMGATEVTHDVFAVFRERGLDSPVGAAPASRFDVDGVARPSPPYEDPAHGMGGPGRPATGMTRLAALHFARWLSEKTGRLYRLPTEAEWERACRVGRRGVYGFGSDSALLNDHAWHAGNSGGSIQDVGTKEPNAWGIHDLHGNVAEWTLDPYYAEFYAGLAEDGSARNPTTGTSARGRGVVRGGAFDDDARALRCADRVEETPAWKRRDPQIPKSRWWNTDAPHVGMRLVSPARDHTPEEIRTYWDALLGAR